MSDTVCLKLPFLRGDCLAGGAEPIPDSSFALRLWPGLPPENMDRKTHWLPEAFPFSPREALALLRDLSDLDFRTLESMRPASGMAASGEAAGYREEMAALAGFSRSGINSGLPAARTRERIAREQAHKVLLWIWAQEERLGEIAFLAGSYGDLSRKLANNFLDPADGGAISPCLPDAGIALDATLLPGWNVCLANACVFIPPGTPILAEGKMAEDLLEMFDFSPARGIDGCPERAALDMIRQPLWRILSHSGPRGEADCLAETYNQERTWLVWRKNDI